MVIANTWAWPVGGPHFEIFSHLLGGPLGRLLIRHCNLFVDAMIPAGHRLRKLTGQEMTHYRQPLASAERRAASAVLPRRITGSRAFLAEIEAALPGIESMPTLIIWATGDIAFGDNELRCWEQIFPDHRTEIIEGAGHYVQSDAPNGSRWRSATG